MAFEDVSDIDFKRAEAAHRQAGWAHTARNQKDRPQFQREAQRFWEIGMRSARAGDSRLLKTLERIAEVLRTAQHQQHGARGFTVDGMSVELTEVGLWRAAYECADRGQPLENFGYLYGGAAWLCGYVPNWQTR